MRKTAKIFQFSILLIFLTVNSLCAQPEQPTLSEKEQKLLNEHVKGGQPDSDILLIRNAYVLSYNEEYRIPNWVAYHIVSDYLKTPKRDGKFKNFRTDMDVEDPVKTSEYNGLFSSKGYARGHMAPYKISGGDRDDDGFYAVFGENVNSDEDDEETVFQINLMTNISPQHHNAINGPGGLWYKLERWIQDELVEENQKELWVFAGTIVYESEDIEGVGKDDSIVVSNLFFKIVIMESGDDNNPHVLAFLFPHFKNKDDVKEKSIFEYLVTIDYIEANTGLDFFSEISEEHQKEFESKIKKEHWEQYFNN